MISKKSPTPKRQDAGKTHKCAHQESFLHVVFLHTVEAWYIHKDRLMLPWLMVLGITSN
jgi:hypothetical protein